MSHLQAYHTSCRDGLEGRSGFQFNAASPGIEPELLRQLASSHASYQPPRDYPREPAVEQLPRFPVALKSCAVAGVPVVSQTVYVGREFRGRDGEPDSGRFGNYFSHIVVANRSAAEPFDGLLPIELWRAPHWQIEESRTTDLPELASLQPGACDLQWTLEQLAPRRTWLGAVLDGALAALEGGPRVVLVEPGIERAAAWVAWVSYSLPTDLAAALTFSTFDGQPRHAYDVQLCVTTPGCDLAFAEHELGHDVLLLDVSGDSPPATRLLYARVAEALAAQGADALAAARHSAGDGSVERRGAQLAVRSGTVRLALAEHVPSLLELVVEHATAGRWETALQVAAELPSQAERSSLRGWAAAHACARSATAEPAREMADQALSRLTDAIPDLPTELEQVAPDSPTSPSPAVLASWLERLERANDGAQRAAQIDGGLRLGLIGCNVALDRRVAEAIAEGIESPPVARLLATLALETRHDDLVEEVVSGLARAAFADRRELPRLQRVIAEPALSRTAQRLAARANEFDERFVWERLRVEADPASLPDALSAVAPLAIQAGRGGELKALFGPDGPVGIEDHELLLRAFKRCEQVAPTEDVDSSLAALASVALGDDESGRALAVALRTAAPVERLSSEPLFLAWQAVRITPPAVRFAEWCEWVAYAATAPVERLPDERHAELCQLASTVAVQALDSEAMLQPDRRSQPVQDPLVEYGIAVRSLYEGFGEHLQRAVGQELTRRVTKGRDRARVGAAAFAVFAALPPETGELLETALAPAVRELSPRRLQAIQELLDESGQLEWEQWLERGRLPRRGGHTVSRLLRGEGR